MQGGQREKALAFLREIPKKRPEPEVITHSAATSACEKDEQEDLCDFDDTALENTLNQMGDFDNTYLYETLKEPANLYQKLERLVTGDENHCL